jgi:hypothetical protein
MEHSTHLEATPDLVHATRVDLGEPRARRGGEVDGGVEEPVHEEAVLPPAAAQEEEGGE